MSSSIGKRQREQQKRERAKVKAERKAVRQATTADATDLSLQRENQLPPRSEAELIDDLRALQHAFGDGALSAEDFAERRTEIQAQLDRRPS